MHIADPLLLDLGDLGRAHVCQDFVQDAHQYLVVSRDGHCQLIAIRRFPADIKAFELELAQAPDTGSEIAHHRVHFIGRQCLQG